MSKSKWDLTPEQRRELNLERKIGLEKKKKKTTQINLEVVLRHLQEETAKYTPVCFAYFIDQDSRIISGAYLNNPEQALSCADLGAQLDACDAGYAIADFTKKVTGLLSRNDLIGTEIIPQTYEKDSGHIPVLILLGPKKYLDTLDCFLADDKAKNFKSQDLRTASSLFH